jgi:hypothetical protein
VSEFLNEVLFAVALLLALGVVLLTVRVCARDAKLRGKSPLLVCFFVLAFFPLGLIAWLLFRPPLLTASRLGVGVGST